MARAAWLLVNASWPRKSGDHPAQRPQIVRVARAWCGCRASAAFVQQRLDLAEQLPHGGELPGELKCKALIIKSQGRRWMKSSGSRRSQRSNVGRSSRLSTSQSPACISRAARSRSSAASAWCRASSIKPCPANQAAALRWSSVTCSGTHLGQQSALEQFLEQVVIAVPLPVVVQGNHKEVIALQPLNAGRDVARGTIAAGGDCRGRIRTARRRTGPGWRSPAGISGSQASDRT